MEDGKEMEDEKERIKRENGIRVFYFSRGVVTGIMGLCLAGIAILPDDSSYDKSYNVTPGPSSVLSYDVDGDGFDDFVAKNGEVSLRQGNGSYISLAEHARNLSRDVEDSYKLQECEDGLYRTIGSGYVSGVEKDLIGMVNNDEE